jgi:hypothetical protein
MRVSGANADEMSTARITDKHRLPTNIDVCVTREFRD